jgi:arsenate reductase
MSKGPSPIRVYAYSGCDTCRKAVRFLNEHAVPHELIAIREQPPTRAELKRVLAALGGDLRKLFNTSGQDYRALGLGAKLPGLSEADALDLLTKNGNLVKRPFVVTATGGWVGFQDEAWKQRIAGLA